MNTNGNDILAQIRNRAAAGAALLARINTTSDSNFAGLSTALVALRMDAEAVHAEYPQYKAFWDGWKIGRVTRTVKTKAGLAFEKGDLCIFEISNDAETGKPSLTAYSLRTGNNTGLPVNYVRAL